MTNTNLSKKCSSSGQMDWEKIITRPDRNTNWAMLIPKSIQNFPVQTFWGDTLLANRPGIGHGFGDFLVCADNGCGQPNLNDVWVVNGEVFPRTYDLHSFPNMFTSSVTTAKTPVPQVTFMKKSPITSKVDELAITIAKGLQAKGHRLGKLTNNSIERKSFTVDNGAYGITLNVSNNGNFIGIMNNASGAWKEIAGWCLDDNAMSYNIDHIHFIISGDKKDNAPIDRALKALKDDPNTNYVNVDDNEIESFDNIVAKRAAERVLKIVQGLAPKLGFDRVDMSIGSWYGKYRINIARENCNGYAVIDFNGSTGYGCFLSYDDKEDEIGAKVDSNNADSIKNLLKILYEEFNKHNL